MKKSFFPGLALVLALISTLFLAGCSLSNSGSGSGPTPSTSAIYSATFDGGLVVSTHSVYGSKPTTYASTKGGVIHIH